MGTFNAICIPYLPGNWLHVHTHERMEWRYESLPADVTFLFPNNQADESICGKLFSTYLRTTDLKVFLKHTSHIVHEVQVN